MTLGEFEFERSFLFFEAGGVTSFPFLSPLTGVSSFATILVAIPLRAERVFVSCPMDSRVAGGEEEENAGRGGSEGVGAGVMGGVG